jgi:hypothetical protein
LFTTPVRLVLSYTSAPLAAVRSRIDQYLVEICVVCLHIGFYVLAQGGAEAGFPRGRDNGQTRERAAACPTAPEGGAPPVLVFLGVDAGTPPRRRSPWVRRWGPLWAWNHATSTTDVIVVSDAKSLNRPRHVTHVIISHVTHRVVSIPDGNQKVPNEDQGGADDDPAP